MENKEKEWAAENFGGAKLRDERRTRRVEKIATAMAQSPGSSIPQLFINNYDIKASYNLFKNKQSTPENIQAGHREKVAAEIAKPGQYLLIEDSTEIIWTSNKIKAGMGSVGGNLEHQQGFHLHSVLAVEWQKPTIVGQREPVQILGFLDQQYYVREMKDKAAKPTQRKNKKTDDAMLETELWEQASQNIGPVSANASWIRVCDRGADIYEFLMGSKALGHQFVVRAKHNRVLLGDDNKKAGKLFDQLRDCQSIGEFQLSVYNRDKAPTAKLNVSVMPVVIRSPQRAGIVAGQNPPLICNAIRVWEAAAPAGVEPLEWILLVSAEVSSFEQALECVAQYCCRWLIEEFHKALKTGLGAERLQLEQAHQLFAAIAIMSVVALRLIHLREWLRIEPDLPASQAGLTQTELTVLRLKLNRPILSIKDIALAIGRLGGHMNRKSDGMPGWQSLWRGMLKLQSLVEGFLIANNMQTFG